MKKVHISLFSVKGDKLVSAIGLLDTETKVMFIPKVSKKGTSYIDIVKYDGIKDCNNGWLITEYYDTEDGRTFANVYRVRDLEVAKAE